MHTRLFQDYDDYAHAVEQVDARFMLRKLEQSRWQLGDICLPGGVRVQHCWSGSGLIVQGSGTPGGVLLAIPAAGQFVANGQSVSGDGALLIAADQEFLVTMTGRHRCFNVFVPDALLQRSGLLTDDGKLRQTPTQVLQGNSRGERSVATLLTRFVANAASGPELAAGSKALANFELGLVNAIRMAWGPAHDVANSSAGRHKTVDRHKILDAIDIIEAAPTNSITMSELVGRTSVPERTLRAGFRKYLGMSPTQYMQLRLMHKARQRLAGGSPEQLTVARVAADLGIWDFGRFAQRYRHIFGESPSATLRAPAHHQTLPNLRRQGASPLEDGISSHQVNTTGSL